MAYDFPATPEVGDTYDKFTWNGSAWRMTATSGHGGTSFDGLITDLYGPTGADGVPAAYNLVIVDKETGEVKTIPDYDFIQPE